MGSFSLMHWLVVGIIAILLLGGGRFSHMMGDVAKGIKNFKKGMAEDDQPAQPTRIEGKAAPEPGYTPEAERAREEQR
ncbi:twin-arginine translocase TatA/TatE family subunit [Sphingomonas sp. HT-1]|jgi:sec-independent protein translocase protein TatA|uniref:twin-arginine translocase TatA/TatE family subunit n=1 Tax=unclassified Sphingomonas TaxID=196159 RepID=UPI0002E34B88|nr:MULTISPECIES: twin-arginine translocase TatA/TatE family subunit [unclassified Sphingomonas]KTF67563.1 preprotein translocase subunit TatA [Sphingomonas sp. WG]